MERKIITTLDGSTTIQLVDWDECYHSKMGAIQEAYHVFIQNGLDFFDKKPVSILEIGFGTGLNAFITCLEAQKRNQMIQYSGVEAYPVSLDEALAMNYPSQLDAVNGEEIFKQLHLVDWETENSIGDNFRLIKRKQFFNDIDDVGRFDLIYFDAFGFQVQPELWSVEIFQKMYNALKGSGVLVTYAARGVVKRNLKEVGFEVKKVPGPPGKREMMIGFKNFLRNF
ncbi:tRNA (5-methylaminomethyl-2-thiouridine)(34)-methyltransferase MnmD [Flavobacterium sp. H122]|uniref:tRNA (5-methylaminomethyl-2-thiouridine)(34)-methyltransferase MnmD n=1 Tax=Flavobacterium sp. H122 TaxID=2529860 RepID=UPI0010A9A747|nr:tRNA (5-methylaminomethyl-2-thiouridine)(34)-methyltransferase MnmD [Flavobacterium sp. H122]